MKTLHVGIIGIGFGQQVHVPAFRAIEGCEVSALCASSEERARTAANKLGIHRAYGRFQDLVEKESLDIISIAVPPHLQPEIASFALEKGIAVFAEKPLGVSVNDTKRLASRAQELATANVVDFEFPEIPVWKECARLLRSGEVGVIRHVSLTWNLQIYVNRMRLNNWRTDPQRGGGTLQSFGSHVFYNLEWLIGPIHSLRCSMSKALDDPRPAETVVSCDVRFCSGATGTIQIQTDNYLGDGHRVEILGSRGNLRIQNASDDHVSGFRLWQGIQGVNKKYEEIVLPRHPLHPGNEPNKEIACDGRVFAVTAVAERFVQWVRSGEPSSPDFRAGHRVQQLIQAALDSSTALQGSWVEISPSVSLPGGANSQ